MAKHLRLQITPLQPTIKPPGMSPRPKVGMNTTCLVHRISLADRDSESHLAHYTFHPTCSNTTANRVLHFLWTKRKKHHLLPPPAPVQAGGETPPPPPPVQPGTSGMRHTVPWPQVSGVRGSGSSLAGHNSKATGVSITQANIPQFLGSLQQSQEMIG